MECIHALLILRMVHTLDVGSWYIGTHIVHLSLVAWDNIQKTTYSFSSFLQFVQSPREDEHENIIKIKSGSAMSFKLFLFPTSSYINASYYYNFFLWVVFHFAFFLSFLLYLRCSSSNEFDFHVFINKGMTKKPSYFFHLCSSSANLPFRTFVHLIFNKKNLCRIHI